MSYTTSRDLIQKARVLRNNMTLAEKILWSRLRSKQIDGYKFRRQYPIYEYIVDFYCHELKLIIEVDGEVHTLHANADYDKKRERLFEINGFSIIRFSNYEVVSEINSVVQKIIFFIKTNPGQNTVEPQGVKKV